MSKKRAENHPVDIITIESKAYLDLIEKINVVYDYVSVQLDKYREREDREWVDSYDVINFLHISERTLQRRINEGAIVFSKWGGRNYFTIGDIKRAIEQKLLKTTQENLEDLIENHRRYLHER